MVLLHPPGGEHQQTDTDHPTDQRESSLHRSTLLAVKLNLSSGFFFISSSVLIALSVLIAVANPCNLTMD
jgi:hypothetical protein